MSIKQKDKNRAALVKAIVEQNGGKIFTVIAKRKSPKVSYRHIVGQAPDLTSAQYRKLVGDDFMNYEIITENFMEMTCRTGVKKDLKGGESTIRHCTDLISVNLTNGNGYRCFSAYNVLELRAGGTTIKFKEADVIAFEGE